MEDLLVNFGHRLERSEFCNRNTRLQTVQDGIAAIRAQSIGVTFGRLLQSACAVVVQGTQPNIAKLKKFLDRSGVGTYTQDQPGHDPFVV
ncbi:MAG: hypothetical protein V1876_01890 [Candidatus Peregrinibacteria bacterium]